MTNSVWCRRHHEERGHLCHVRDCDAVLIRNTRCCETHQPEWKRHTQRFGGTSVLGLRRLIRHANEEQLPWNRSPRT